MGVAEAVGVAGVGVREGIGVTVADGNGCNDMEGTVGGAGIKLHAEIKMNTNKTPGFRI